MKGVGYFLAPDFYESFQCKCGDCRNCCCEGWDVGISQDEFYKILGLDASDDLRQRINRGFYVSHDATPDRFAILNHDWMGQCPFRGEDGLCQLQAEKGEENIPAICKLYPRSIRTELGEATLSNSCEKIVEMLIEKEESIRFKRILLPYEVTGTPDPEQFALRMQCIGLLQDRNSTFKESIEAIGYLICGRTWIKKPFEETLDVMLDFCRLYEEISPSLSEYCKNAIRTLSGIDEFTFKKRMIALDMLFPNFDLTAENLTANHFFYSKFPYSETEETEQEEFISLCGMIAFMDIICAGNLEQFDSRDSMVDLIAFAFRMIEHTRFPYNAHLLLEKRGYDTPALAYNLLHL